jgi:hypothetical protein
LHILYALLFLPFQSETLFDEAPENWREETFSIPMSFAPEIKYTGIEELRFAPGMFQSDEPDYFTYAFIWWLEGEASFTEERLRQDLLLYYKGLYQAVSKKENKDTGSFTASVRTLKDPNWIDRATTHFEASVQWIDPFVTEKPLILDLKIGVWFCREQNRTAVFFLIAPDTAGSSPWRDLYGLRAGACGE